MIELLRKSAGYWMAALGIISISLFSGCQTNKVSDLPPVYGNTFHIGDQVIVSFALLTGGGINDPNGMPPHTESVREDGTITLQYVGPVKVEGKTAGQLQKDIHDLYVPKYFTELNVTVTGATLYFYVDGEVVNRGGKEYPGEMTIVKAISVAGGFTDFAKRTKVQLTRGNHTEIINVTKAIKDPRYDVPVYPGDRINVPRRILW